jgi:3-oxoacyl-[acyl-carrier-protein] synthase II
MVSSPKQRVVLTGVGSVSALGAGGFTALGRALEAGRPAIDVVRAFAVDGSGSRLAGELPEGVLADLVARDEARRLSRICQLTVAACRLALRDARMDAGVDGTELGLIIGTEFGDLRSSQEFADGYLEKGSVGLSAITFPNTVMNTMAATAAIAVGAKGPSVTLNQATVAGELAVARGAFMVASARLPGVLVGGVDEICPILYRMLSALGGLSPMAGGPEGCWPFDRRHNGPVRGEGATFVLLETLEGALRRGATIRAELRGVAWGNSPVGRDRVPRSDGDGSVIARALTRAGLAPDSVGWAYLSGTGDPPLDDWQLKLVRATFGNHRPRLTSLTPLVGDHAGLGALRVAAAAWTAGTGHLPGLPSLSEPVRDDCAFATGPGTPAREAAGVVHGVARGGTQVALVVSRFEAHHP